MAIAAQMTVLEGPQQTTVSELQLRSIIHRVNHATPLCHCCAWKVGTFCSSVA